jgi:nitrous oxidase accessory protein
MIRGNRIFRARDGIYLSFTDGLVVRGNDVTDARYGVHSMFSQNITVEQNRIHETLLGAALMNSNRLVFRNNRLEKIRTGATPYGVLLKDIGDLRLENNLFIQNRVGIYADGSPDRDDRQAIIRHNLLIGNESAFALQSNVRLTVSENDIVDNLSEVRAEGGSLSSDNHWSSQGRGNFWSDYRGYDRNGDGIGEVSFTVSGAIDYLLHRNQSIRAFLYTPAHSALELAARMFPLFRPDPLLTDPAPLMRPVSAVARVNQ